MTDDETERITIEVTKQQFDDALRAINKREVEMGESERYGQDRKNALCNVWAQIYRGGVDTFREVDE